MVDGLGSAEIRDLLRRNGVAKAVFSSLSKKDVNGPAFLALDEAALMKTHGIEDPHCRKQVLRLQKRLRESPADFLADIPAHDVTAAEKLEDFYARNGVTDKIGKAQPIVDSYADKPHLLLESFQKKYPGKPSEIAFLGEWVSAHEAGRKKLEQYGEKLDSVYKKVLPDEAGTGSARVLYYADDPRALLATLEKKKPKQDLKWLKDWAAEVEEGREQRKAARKEAADKADAAKRADDKKKKDEEAAAEEARWKEQEDIEKKRKEEEAAEEERRRREADDARAAAEAAAREEARRKEAEQRAREEEERVRREREEEDKRRAEADRRRRAREEEEAAERESRRRKMQAEFELREEEAALRQKALQRALEEERAQWELEAARRAEAQAAREREREEEAREEMQAERSRRQQWEGPLLVLRAKAAELEQRLSAAAASAEEDGADEAELLADYSALRRALQQRAESARSAAVSVACQCRLPAPPGADVESFRDEQQTRAAELRDDAARLSAAVADMESALAEARSDTSALRRRDADLRSRLKEMRRGAAEVEMLLEQSPPRDRRRRRRSAAVAEASAQTTSAERREQSPRRRVIVPVPVPVLPGAWHGAVPPPPPGPPPHAHVPPPPPPPPPPFDGVGWLPAPFNAAPPPRPGSWPSPWPEPGPWHDASPCPQPPMEETVWAAPAPAPVPSPFPSSAPHPYRTLQPTRGAGPTVRAPAL